MRDRDAALLARFDATFASSRIVEITATIIERATELRARYGFRSPDAIHLATAIEERVDMVLTGDASLARCTDVRVEVLAAAP